MEQGLEDLHRYLSIMSNDQSETVNAKAVDDLRPNEFPGMSRPPSSETLFLFKNLANPERVRFNKPRPLEQVLELNEKNAVDHTHDEHVNTQVDHEGTSKSLHVPASLPLENSAGNDTPTQENRTTLQSLFANIDARHVPEQTAETHADTRDQPRTNMELPRAHHFDHEDAEAAHPRVEQDAQSQVSYAKSIASYTDAESFHKAVKQRELHSQPVPPLSHAVDQPHHELVASRPGLQTIYSDNSSPVSAASRGSNQSLESGVPQDEFSRLVQEQTVAKYDSGSRHRTSPEGAPQQCPTVHAHDSTNNAFEAAVTMEIHKHKDSTHGKNNRKNKGKKSSRGRAFKEDMLTDSSLSDDDDSDTDAYLSDTSDESSSDDEEFKASLGPRKYRKYKERRAKKKRRALQRARRKRKLERKRTEYRAKNAYLGQLDKMKMQGLPLSRDFTIQDDLEDMRLEYERHQACQSMIQKVETMRKWIGIILAIAEFILVMLRIRVDGWSSEVVRELQSRKYDPVLEKLYRKYWKRNAPSPELSLGLMILGMLAFKWLENRERRLHDRAQTGGQGAGAPSMQGALTSVARALIGSFVGPSRNSSSASNSGQSGAGMGGGNGLLSAIGSMFGGGNLFGSRSESNSGPKDNPGTDNTDIRPQAETRSPRQNVRTPRNATPRNATPESRPPSAKDASSWYDDENDESSPDVRHSAMQNVTPREEDERFHTLRERAAAAAERRRIAATH